MKPIHHRRRQGSIIITLLAMLVFVVLFFGMHCFKQLQANRQVPESRKPFTATKNHHWPSPDSRLAFRLPRNVLLGSRPIKLADQDRGRVLFESDFEGEIVRCKWRGDNKACAFEYKPNAGGNDVVLLLIEGKRVTSCRPADVIQPHRYLPEGDQKLATQWEHTVKLGEFRRDGDLLVQWAGTATQVRPGERDRETRVECDFRIRYTTTGDLFLMESFPRGEPKTKILPVTGADNVGAGKLGADNVVIPRGVHLPSYRPNIERQVRAARERRAGASRTVDSE